MTPHSDLELISIKNINKSENNTLHTFTTRKCRIKCGLSDVTN